MTVRSLRCPKCGADDFEMIERSLLMCTTCTRRFVFDSREFALMPPVVCRECERAHFVCPACGSSVWLTGVRDVFHVGFCPQCKWTREAECLERVLVGHPANRAASMVVLGLLSVIVLVLLRLVL